MLNKPALFRYTGDDVSECSRLRTNIVSMNEVLGKQTNCLKKKITTTSKKTLTQSRHPRP